MHNSIDKTFKKKLHHIHSIIVYSVNKAFGLAFKRLRARFPVVVYYDVDFFETLTIPITLLRSNM